MALVGGVLLSAVISSCAGPLGRGGYESAAYTTVKSEGSFEIRDYPELVVATTIMKNDDDNKDSAFMRLFGYISGKNESGEKIAMTTPVFASSDDDEEAMSFVVPKEVADTGAPQANSKKIAVSTRPAGRFAVFRYSGRWTEANEKAASEKLTKWMKEQKLEATSTMEKASYDPPFTPPFMRRNEVLVRIKE